MGPPMLPPTGSAYLQRPQVRLYDKFVTRL